MNSDAAGFPGIRLEQDDDALVLHSETPLHRLCSGGRDQFSDAEIHMGQTSSPSTWLQIQRRDRRIADGAMSADGHVWGCYLHGLFANDNLRRAWLCSLGWQPDALASFSLEAAFDHLADAVEAHLDMTQLEQIIA